VADPCMAVFGFHPWVVGGALMPPVHASQMTVWRAFVIRWQSCSVRWALIALPPSAAICTASERTCVLAYPRPQRPDLQWSLVYRVIRLCRACVRPVTWLLNVCRHAIEHHPWWLRATAGVHGSIRWPIDRCAPRHIPCEMRPLERTAIKAAQRLSCALHAGWRAREASGGTHARTGTRARTHAHTGDPIKNRADTRTLAARMQTRVHTNTPAHAHKHTGACTHAQTARPSSATAARRWWKPSVRASCGSDARESGRLLLLLVCEPPASRVRRTRRCPQQTSAGSDVARETAGSCAGACVCDGLHD
jgi:hypothetical protein